MNECVLVADDDREIVNAIAILLEKEGYQVLRAYDGLEALDLALTRPVQLVLLDVMMPRMDGLSALMKLREKRNLPVIVLSAKGEGSDKILGLSMGADDYVTKPYYPQELLARVKSQLRRYTQLGGAGAERQGSDKILGLSMGADDYVTKPYYPQELLARVKSQLRRYTQLGGAGAERQEGELRNGRLIYRPEERQLLADGEPVRLTATELKIVELLMRHPGRVFPEGELRNGRLIYRPEERQLLADGEPVRLTATELKIVELLMRHPGRVFPAEEIYRRVWNEDTVYAPENTVMVHIRHIREKIELDPKEPECIKVVWGIGYKMENLQGRR